MNVESAPITVRQNVRWLPADMDTPISLFLGMAKGSGILLESAEVDGRWGRYSVLACDMGLILSCREGRLDCMVEDERFAGKKGLALYIDGKYAGALGELNKRYTAKWRTSNAVFYAEIEVENLLAAKLQPEFLIPVSTFPATTRDVAFIKPASLTHAEIVKFVNNIHLKNLELTKINSLIM